MKFRPWHILQPNVSQSRPQHVIFFDCETEPNPISETEDRHTLKLGWACYVRYGKDGSQSTHQWFPFDTPYEFWGFVDGYTHRKTKLYLVAHNIGFDFRVVQGFAHSEAMGWLMKGMYNKGMTCLMRFKTSQATIQVLDMTNFFTMNLKSLGNLVGLEKLDIDFKSCSESELSVYCYRDVEILMRAWDTWIKFLDNHELGDFRLTLPSQAFHGFRHRFMTYPIKIHGNAKVCELERQAYHGGRTECFRVGRYEDGPYFQLDVNSMYGYQMESKEYPMSLQGYKDSLPVRSLVNKLRNFAVVSRVNLTTKQPVFVTKHRGRNVYPVGTFETVLTTPELLFALDHCEIHEVKEIAWYRKAPIFRKYTHYFHSLKQDYERQHNSVFRKIAKLFINALYGKFGQRGLKITFDTNSTPNLPDSHNVWDNRTKTAARIYKIGDTSVYEEKEGESYNSFPAIAAHVTAYARLHLWNLICMANREDVFYSDTDCLIVNQRGYDNLLPVMDDYKMGYLKIEHQGEFLEIHSPKDYVLGDKIRRKGIRKNAVQVTNGVYEQDQFLGLAGAIRRENPDLVTIKRITKTLKRKIYSGVVQEDGRITPFRLPLQLPLL